jgi:hypothetical protein
MGALGEREPLADEEEMRGEDEADLPEEEGKRTRLTSSSGARRMRKMSDGVMNTLGAIWGATGGRTAQI